ncbi:MAG: hypothetical protein V3T24_10245, partial [Longimicrobiales bacterium]
VSHRSASRVGRIAYVPGARARRIDPNGPFQPSFSQVMPHNALRQRGTADIPKTDEEDRGL